MTHNEQIQQKALEVLSQASKGLRYSALHKAAEVVTSEIKLDAQSLIIALGQA